MAPELPLEYRSANVTTQQQLSVNDLLIYPIPCGRTERAKLLFRVPVGISVYRHSLLKQIVASDPTIVETFPSRFRPLLRDLPVKPNKSATLLVPDHPSSMTLSAKPKELFWLHSDSLFGVLCYAGRAGEAYAINLWVTQGTRVFLGKLLPPMSPRNVQPKQKEGQQSPRYSSTRDQR